MQFLKKTFDKILLKIQLFSNSQLGGVLFMLAFLKAAVFSFYGLGLLDEGESLHNALRILSGQLPYRDFFAVFPPLHNYFYALTFYSVGKLIIGPRLIASFIFAFSPVLIFLILQKYIKKSFAIIPAVIAIFLNINVERWLFFTPLFLGIYFYSKSFTQKGKWQLFFSGLFLGVTGLFRIDIPGAFALACTIGLLINQFCQNKRNFHSLFYRISIFILGGILPISLMVLWLFSNNIFDDFLKNTLVRPIAIEKIHSLPFPPLNNLIPVPLSLSTLSNAYVALYGYSILLVYLATGIFLVKDWNNIWRKVPLIGVLFIAGILMTPYLFGRSDSGHLVKGGLPFLFLGAYLLDRVYINKKLITFSLACFIILSIFVGALGESFWWLKFNNQVVDIGGDTLRLNSTYINGTTIPSTRTLQEAVGFIQQNSTTGEPVLVLPYMSAIYYLANRMSPIIYDNVLAGYITDNQEDEYIKKIDLSAVNLIIYDPKNGPKMKSYRFSEYNPKIHQYIMNNYIVVHQTQEGWLFMKRKK